MNNAFTWICGAMFGAAVALAMPPQPSYYITFPYTVPLGTAIRVKAGSRDHALTKTSVTVWTEKEWQDCAHCKKLPVFDWPPPSN